MDGMRCDVAGNLYITRYGKGTVAQVSPQGEVLCEIQLSGRNPTNLAFGGTDGRLVYVTVADRGNVELFQAELSGREWVLAHRR
jgi:sugar lactone lactonase YvrE